MRASSAPDAASAALSVFLLAVGPAPASAFVQLGGTVGRLSPFIKETRGDVVPAITTIGGTMDRVNEQERR